MLLDSETVFNYANATPTSSYDAETSTISIKATHDLLHEVGHSLWYVTIPARESIRKRAVIRSMPKDRSHRKKLWSCMIPSIHKEYAALVGAYSGQFLLKSHPNNRMNDLEEQFARNFDRLARGMPLVTLPGSTASIEDFLAFYREKGITDSGFEKFYRNALIHKDGLQKIPIEQMRDGLYINSKLVEAINQMKRHSYSQKTA
jgi:hypothetical protein